MTRTLKSLLERNKMVFLRNRMLPFEDRVNAIETELKALLAKEKPAPFSKDWWIDRAMSYLMANQKLRTQVFRFIESFPDLRTSEDLHRHILEDFAPEKLCLPIFLHNVYGIGYELEKKFGPNPFSALLAKLAVETVARHFIVDKGIQAISAAISKLKKKGAGYSLDLLGEEVLSEQEANEYVANYKKLIRQLNVLAPEVDISIKLSSLYSQFHPLAGDDSKRIIKERLDDILSHCWVHGGRVTIDIEQYQFRDLTLEIFKELACEFAKWRWGLCIAHQSYLKDSEDVLRSLCCFAEDHGLHLGVRIVKGAYWDYEVIHAKQNNWPVPVYMEKWETDRSFEKNVTIALEHYPWIRTAIGTHNLHSLAYAMAKIEDLGLPKDALEVQALYGLGNRLIRAVRKLGYPVRVYIGTGDLARGVSFLTRRLLENTSQNSSAFFKEY